MSQQRGAAEVALDEVDLVLVRHARPLLRSGQQASRWLIDPTALPEVAALGRGLLGVLPGLAERQGTAVVSSHDPKAVATARELARVWGASSLQASGLEEHHRGPLPIVDDLTWRATVSRLFSNPETLVFGDETAREAEQRFAAGVAGVLAGATGGGPTAIVSHGTVITLYLAAANGWDSVELWQSLQLPEAFLVRSSDRRLAGRVAADGELRLPG